MVHILYKFNKNNEKYIKYFHDKISHMQFQDCFILFFTLHLDHIRAGLNLTRQSKLGLAVLKSPL